MAFQMGVNAASTRCRPAMLASTMIPTAPCPTLPGAWTGHGSHEVGAVFVDPLDLICPRLDRIAAAAFLLQKFKLLPIEHVGVDVDVAHGGAPVELVGMPAEKVVSAPVFDLVLNLSARNGSLSRIICLGTLNIPFAPLLPADGAVADARLNSGSAAAESRR